MFFPTNKKCIDDTKTIFIYQSTAHTEILIPLPYFTQTYQEKFPNLIKNNTHGYLAFSYGDEAFMMEVPTWDKIKIGVALKSLFLNTPALLRVGYYWGIKEEECIKIKLSKQCLEKLNQGILDAFTLKDGKFQRYDDHYKERNSFYFKAKKSYNLFHTCNSWSGNKLRDAGLGVPYITPFAQQVTHNFQ